MMLNHLISVDAYKDVLPYAGLSEDLGTSVQSLVTLLWESALTGRGSRGL